MSHPEVLSVGFLQAHGVELTRPLRDWLTRVSFMARAQPDEAKRVRYEKWALCTIEAAVAAPRGVGAVKWAQQSTVMPRDAASKMPAWWPTGTEAAPYPNSSARSALLEETLRRAPTELEPFVRQGFGLYDREVASGRRTYEQVTFVEMLNIAKSLMAKAPPPQQSSASPSPPVQSAQTHRPPPSRDEAPHAALSPVPAASSTYPPAAHKRSASGSPDEPPAKKKRAVAATMKYAPGDRPFVFQLGGVHAVQEAPPPVFVGRSTAMERPYTRYEPLVDDIRPLPVLEEAYAYIVRRAREVTEAENAKAGQKYLSDQLKGMRQDLRVQNVVNDFTVFVYETHARLCLETGDIGEFNQCQAALKQFYQAPSVNLHSCRPQEFFLYRIVYLTLSEQYDSLSTELITFTNDQITGMTRPGAEVDGAAVKATLALCNACINGDTPTICRGLMDFHVHTSHLVRIYLQKLRIMWLKEILTAMKGSLTMRFLMASLGFTPVAADAPGQQSDLFWLDGSATEAEARLTDLFTTLKVDLPRDFSFETEVLRTKHTGPNPHAVFPSLDAATALKAVDEYLLYLGTRKDASRT